MVNTSPKLSFKNIIFAAQENIYEWFDYRVNDYFPCHIYITSYVTSVPHFLIMSHLCHSSSSCDISTQFLIIISVLLILHVLDHNKDNNEVCLSFPWRFFFNLVLEKSDLQLICFFCDIIKLFTCRKNEDVTLFRNTKNSYFKINTIFDINIFASYVLYLNTLRHFLVCFKPTDVYYTVGCIIMYLDPQGQCVSVSLAISIG